MASRTDRTASKPPATSIYSDVTINFTAHPNTGILMQRNNADAVKRALRNLIMTNKGERPYNLGFGCNIRSILFEQATEINQRQLRTFITEAIENYEKRALLEDVVITLANDEQTYVIDVYFRLINSPDVQNLNVKLDRIR